MIFAKNYENIFKFVNTHTILYGTLFSGHGVDATILTERPTGTSDMCKGRLYGHLVDEQIFRQK